MDVQSHGPSPVDRGGAIKQCVKTPLYDHITLVAHPLVAISAKQ